MSAKAWFCAGKARAGVHHPNTCDKVWPNSGTVEPSFRTVLVEFLMGEFFVRAGATVTITTGHTEVHAPHS